MSDQITYDDKVDLQVATNIANINKVTASDMNEIKNVVNSHADDIDVANNNITDLNNNKLDINEVLNQASTDTDKPYSADYLNDKLVSVGTTTPTDGERVWFKKSKNLFNKNTANILNAKMSNNTITSDNNERIIFIECKPNTTYTLSKIISNPIRNSIGTTQTLPAIGVAIDNAVYSATSPKTITTNANAKYIVWLVYSINDTTSTLQQMLDSMQIEEGSTATTYEPYVEQSIKVDNEDFISTSDLISVGVNQPTDGRRVWFAKSKNLLPQNRYIATTTINGVTYTNNGDGTFSLTGTATANTTIIIIPANIISLEANQSYYLYSSVPYGGTTFNMSIAMTDNGTSKFILANNTYTPTTAPTNVRLQFYIGSGKSVNATNVKLMLAKGNIAPSQYEPYVKPAIYVDGVKIYEMS